MVILRCRDASFAYDGNEVLSGLNFEINSGDYLCVVGENGSGKSTLIKGLLRLKPPCAGEVSVSGVAAGEVGYLPQQTAAQKDFPASAREVVLSGRLGARGILAFYTKADKSVCDENMRRLGVYDLRGSCFRELSGGQQRRVLLARALCAAKKLLILDEPAAGLDPAASRELYLIIEKLNRQDKMTIIMVSHDISGALQYSSHILHLNNSRLLYFGKTAGYAGSAAGAGLVGRRPDA
ncbi:MAG: ABC transporter ATP-binding protein [Clostridiales bacterium]|jgi:zinc transport system ATP-binding protein|nr:ABC transporter ATP-binding protein [Clostridiales bacterium]